MNDTIQLTVHPLGPNRNKTRLYAKKDKRVPDPSWKKTVKMQGDKAVLVKYANRVYAMCYCPNCADREHYQCWLIMQTNDKTKRIHFRRFLCDDWGEREIKEGDIVVLKDTGKRGGKRAIWRVEDK